jgi:hypothetical protein
MTRITPNLSRPEYLRITASIDNLEQLIKAGVMVTHGTSIDLTNKGRAFTKRQMPY